MTRRDNKDHIRVRIYSIIPLLQGGGPPKLLVVRSKDLRPQRPSVVGLHIVTYTDPFGSRAANGDAKAL